MPTKSVAHSEQVLENNLKEESISALSPYLVTTCTGIFNNQVTGTDKGSYILLQNSKGEYNILSLIHIYLRRDLSIVDSMLQSGLKLSQKKQLRLETLRKIYEQQKYMYDNHTHSVPDRIVSCLLYTSRCV